MVAAQVEVTAGAVKVDAEAVAAGKRFVIVVLSADHDEPAMMQYQSTMPPAWPRMPAIPPVPPPPPPPAPSPAPASAPPSGNERLHGGSDAIAGTTGALAAHSSPASCRCGAFSTRVVLSRPPLNVYLLLPQPAFASARIRPA